MARCIWEIQQRAPGGSGKFRTIGHRYSACEALAVWSRVVARIRSGESGRRGWVRLVRPGPEPVAERVVELVEIGQRKDGTDGWCAS